MKTISIQRSVPVIVTKTNSVVDYRRNRGRIVNGTKLNSTIADAGIGGLCCTPILYLFM